MSYGAESLLFGEAPPMTDARRSSRLIERLEAALTSGSFAKAAGLMRDLDGIGASARAEEAAATVLARAACEKPLAAKPQEDRSEEFDPLAAPWKRSQQAQISPEIEEALLREETLKLFGGEGRSAESLRAVAQESRYLPLTLPRRGPRAIEIAEETGRALSLYAKSPESGFLSSFDRELLAFVRQWLKAHPNQSSAGIALLMGHIAEGLLKAPWLTDHSAAELRHLRASISPKASRKIAPGPFWENFNNSERLGEMSVKLRRALPKLEGDLAWEMTRLAPLEVRDLVIASAADVLIENSRISARRALKDLFPMPSGLIPIPGRLGIGKVELRSAIARLMDSGGATSRRKVLAGLEQEGALARDHYREGLRSGW